MSRLILSSMPFLVVALLAVPVSSLTFDASGALDVEELVTDAQWFYVPFSALEVAVLTKPHVVSGWVQDYTPQSPGHLLRLGSYGGSSQESAAAWTAPQAIITPKLSARSGAILIQAERIAYSAQGNANLQFLPSNAICEGMEEQRVGNVPPSYPWGQSCQEPQDLASLQALKSHGNATLRAWKAHRVIISGVDAACDGRCPVPEWVTTYVDHASGLGEYTWERYRFLELGAEYLELETSGMAEGLTWGAPALTVSMTGRAMLPNVHTEGDGCPDCTGLSPSWIIEGDISLRNMTPTQDGRIEGDLDATLTSARLDETYVDPTSLFDTATTSVAVGTALGIGLILKFLAPLITRVAPGQALEHPRRRQLHAYVVEHPGATLREVMQASQLAAGTARHHLGILTRARLLVEHKHRSTLRYFENHGRFDNIWHSHVLLREPPLRELHQWLSTQGPTMQREILDHGQTEWNWSRSTTQHRLLRLQEANLVTVHPQGRRKIYHAVDAATAHKRTQGTPQRGLTYTVGADGMPTR